MIRWPSAVRDSTEAELAAFDAVCERLRGFDPDLNYEFIDGWLTAVAAGPTVPEPAVWLPLLFEDTFERTFADPADAAQATAVLLARLKVLLAQLDPDALLADPDQPRLNPLIAEMPEEAKDELGFEWSLGFCDGSSAQFGTWPAVPEAEQTELDTLLQRIELLSEAPEGARDRMLREQWPGKEPTRDDLLTAAIFAVQDLRVMWLDLAPRPATRHVEATPGRNDPCPCGSGKKYKKCHGAAA
jgi:uncharacterized protein